MCYQLFYFVTNSNVVFCVSGRFISYEEEYPMVKMLIEQLRETCTKTCHLVPVSSCLDLGGPEISRKQFDSTVFSLATRKGSTGTDVICGLANGPIIIFDLETGMLPCGNLECIKLRRLSLGVLMRSLTAMGRYFNLRWLCRLTIHVYTAWTNKYHYGV